MCKPVAMMLVFCCALMHLCQRANALEYTKPEPENCYLVAMVYDVVNEPGSAKPPLPQSVLASDIYTGWFEWQTLPVPASLLFIAFWLIGFKLTTQPSPVLSRAEPSRYSKAYMEMSMNKKQEPTSC